MRNTDWEALAIGKDEAGNPAIFVGDIGDNFGFRGQISVHRVPEPAVLGNATVTPTTFNLRYPDGARDAESLLVDPSSNRLYVASKRGNDGKLYQAPAQLQAAQTNPLTAVGTAPPYATDGSFAPDGRSYLLRTGKPFGQDVGYVYDVSRTQRATVTLPSQRQGETITYYNRTSVLAGSENDPQIWLVHLPPEAIPPA